MRKLTLALDHLAVHSFDTSPALPAVPGTVHGNSQDTGLHCTGARCPSAACSNAPTCDNYNTCGNACLPPETKGCR
jgi:hypothetical protein